jgi:bifunctional DNA-binding transcriptional regulator/antitoxin component of YhaV-PrlF toxin-antitoxin module
MASRVTERGQITIDQAVRRELHVEPGMTAYQRVVDGRLEIVFLPAPHNRSSFGAFRREGQPPGPMTSEEIEAAAMRAIAEEQASERDVD